MSQVSDSELDNGSEEMPRRGARRLELPKEAEHDLSSKEAPKPKPECTAKNSQVAASCACEPSSKENPECSTTNPEFESSCEQPDKCSEETSKCVARNPEVGSYECNTNASCEESITKPKKINTDKKSVAPKIPCTRVTRSSQKNTGLNTTSTRKNQQLRNNEPLRQFLVRTRRAMSVKEEMSKEFVTNDYAKAESCGYLLRKKTGIIFDDKMELHACPWDANYPENPNRYRVIMERCQQLKLFERCLELPYELVSKDLIMKLHTPRLYEQLQEISAKTDLKDMEDDASQYDAIYFNKETFNAAVIASSCAISLVKSVCDGTVQNGMAIIRPPGHHAMNDEYCGYCYFNNVAIAAQYALDNKLAEKILIVDVDVHHGQATQRMFYDDKRVLYFSIHRYENGEFWPNLRESNYDYIGQGPGMGYNINFPLNAIGLEDSDYLSIVTHILLPVAYEFQPNLIIISAGYDSAMGDDKGEMEITPGFYGHLIMLLSGLAKGKIAVCLEGGYFLPSLAEGAAMTLKSLLGDPPATLQPLSMPHFTVLDMINDIKIYLHKYWNCFGSYELHNENEKDSEGEEYRVPVIKYLGEPAKPPYLTRDCYPTHPGEYKEQLTKFVEELQKEYESLGKNQLVVYGYDKDMLLHTSKDYRHVEMPLRLSATYELFKEWKLDDRCLSVSPKNMDIKVLTNVHKESYVKQILDKKFEALIKHDTTDMFYNDGTLSAIMRAVECLLSVLDSVVKGFTQSGVAIVRPPGHHAEFAKPSGFCYLNNVAIAAQYAIDSYKLSKILIVDFDIHHGNGTQNIFYKSNKVLYLSIHKHDPGKFFPKSPEGGCDYCGEGPGLGFNVNIGLKCDKLHDVDYIAIFHQIVLPIAYSFGPELVIISAGFDAGIHDTLGNYAVTPECFGHFVQLLRPLANGKVILVLEGGYNATTVKYGMNICVKTLLGDPLPPLDFQPNLVNVACRKIISRVITIQKQYWPILSIDKKLSSAEPRFIIKNGEIDPPPSVELKDVVYSTLQLRKIGRFAQRLLNDKKLRENKSTETIVEAKGDNETKEE